jgi:multiple sugar transport system permease protein
MVVLLLVSVYPFIYSLYLSFTNYSLVFERVKFIGLSNYIEMFLGSAFWNSIRVTFTYSITTVILEFVIGLGVALLLIEISRGRRVIMSILTLPMMVVPVVTGLWWRFFFDVQYGVFNYFISLFGLPMLAWLADKNTVMLAYIIMDIWQWTPFMILVLFAGITNIPTDLIEAANVDGASRWKVIKNIILPLLKPVIIIALLIRVMDAIRVFDYIIVNTIGGPGNASESLSVHIYLQGFKYFKVGYSTAVAYVLLIITIILSKIFIRFLPKE